MQGDRLPSRAEPTANVAVSAVGEWSCYQLASGVEVLLPNTIFRVARHSPTG